MMNKVLLIWPWNPNHFRIHELFPIGLGHLVNHIPRDRFDLLILDCSLNDIQPTVVFILRSLSFLPAGSLNRLLGYRVLCSSI